LVFASSFFSIGAAPSAGCSPAFISPLAGSAGAGAAGSAGAGGGGGGAGSSFLPHPPNARVKAKRATTDNETILFLILSSPPFPSHIVGKPNFLGNFYVISLGELQACLKLHKAQMAQPLIQRSHASEINVLQRYGRFVSFIRCMSCINTKRVGDLIH
jgi:hypothetical protein